MAHVFLSLPNTGSILPNQVVSILLASNAQDEPGKRRHQITWRSNAFAAVTGNFNMLWCMALNMRRKLKFDRYSMLHSDISVAPGWVDVLEEEKEKIGAHFISAANIPIKDHHGSTSTGIATGPSVRDPVRRFTLKELFDDLPETFTIQDVWKVNVEKHGGKTGEWKGTPAVSLALNNGMWLIDFNKPWIEKVVFDMTNWIWTKPLPDEEHGVDDEGFTTGISWHMGIDTDDWKFARWCHHVVGLKLAATRKVPLGHIGPHEFRGDHGWGDETDGFWVGTDGTEKEKIELGF